MNIPTRSTLRYSLFALLLGLALAASAAPPRPAPGQPAMKSLQVMKRAPLPFTPFEVRDPETGEPISPDVIFTLPNGQRLRAGEYYAEINRLEREFNALGYSLRDPEPRVLLQKSVIDLGKVKAQVSVLDRDAGSPLRITTPVKPRTGADAGLTRPRDQPRVAGQPARSPTLSPGRPATPATGLAPEPPAMKAPPGTAGTPSTRLTETPPPARPGLSATKERAATELVCPTCPSGPLLDKTRSWHYSAGSNDVISGYLKGKLTLRGWVGVAQLKGETRAGGWLFGNEVRLLRMDSELMAGSGSNRVRIMLSVAGQQLLNVNQSRIARLDGSSSKEQPIDEGTTIPFSIGPIPVSVTLGVQGRAGLGYQYALEDGGVDSDLGPFVDTRAYARAAVDLKVAGAGVEGNLTMLKNGLQLAGDIGTRATVARPHLYYAFSGHNELTLLKGRISAIAWVYKPRWGFPPWKKKEYEWQIIDWGGFHEKRYIFRQGEQKIYF